MTGISVKVKGAHFQGQIKWYFMSHESMLKVSKQNQTRKPLILLLLWVSVATMHIPIWRFGSVTFFHKPWDMMCVRLFLTPITDRDGLVDWLCKPYLPYTVTRHCDGYKKRIGDEEPWENQILTRKRILIQLQKVFYMSQHTPYIVYSLWDDQCFSLLCQISTSVLSNIDFVKVCKPCKPKVCLRLKGWFFLQTFILHHIFFNKKSSKMILNFYRVSRLDLLLELIQ